MEQGPLFRNTVNCFVQSVSEHSDITVLSAASSQQNKIQKPSLQTMINPSKAKCIIEGFLDENKPPSKHLAS